MALTNELLRKWRAKGHGVHSPFAFHLITNILYSPYAYNAFSDVENLLSKNNINPECVNKFNHLSFRLVNHFKTKNILEIGSGKGFNTLFLAAVHPDVSITCIENNAEDIAFAKNLLKKYPNSVTYKKTLDTDNSTKYDAVFIHAKNGYTPDIEMLFALSHEHAFWVFHPKQQPAIKPLLKNIVKDRRVHVVFDMKQTSILFLNPAYNKATYYI